MVKKSFSPRNLPFLQVQILEQVYLDISKNRGFDLEKIAILTDYSPKSKILENAITALVRKNFLIKSPQNGFAVPKDRHAFFRLIIKRNDYAKKTYSTKIDDYLEKKTTVLEPFLEEKSISNLNRYGVIHKWYDYLEDFPYSLIEEKIREYKLKKDSLVVDPFCGSGTTLVSANMIGMNAIGIDANPLMTFVSKVKTTWDIGIGKLEGGVRKVANKFLNSVDDLDNNESIPGFLNSMPKKEINQWLNPRMQKEVALLKSIIMETKDKKIRELLISFGQIVERIEKKVSQGEPVLVI